jgi:hypothetical protein
VTLIEVLIAVTLLSLLVTGVMLAMRVGLSALSRTNSRLMTNRRIAGAERILQEELEGLVPTMAFCAGNSEGSISRLPFFQGEPASMRFVSTYSLQGGWRGAPQILEFQVASGDQGKGVRLVVNEIPYTGPAGSGRLCAGPPLSFKPIEVTPQSFVLADKLEFCRFSFLEVSLPPDPPHWRPDWVAPRWPLAIRVDMRPLDAESSRLPLTTVTARIRVNRLQEATYSDEQ